MVTAIFIICANIIFLNDELPKKMLVIMPDLTFLDWSSSVLKCIVCNYIKKYINVLDY